MNKGTKYSDFAGTGFTGGNEGYAVTTACKDPARFIQFADYLCSDEGQVLTHWGIEGKDYEIQNGKRVIPPDTWSKRVNDPNFKKETGIEVYTSTWPEYGRGVKDSNGEYYQPYTKENIKNTYTKIEKEVLSAYGVNMWMDLYPKANEFPVRKYGAAFTIQMTQDDELSMIMQKYSKITRMRIVEAILGKPDEFDAKWDLMQKELKDAEIEKLEDKMTELVAQKIKMQNN